MHVDDKKYWKGVGIVSPERNATEVQEEIQAIYETITDMAKDMGYPLLPTLGNGLAHVLHMRGFRVHLLLDVKRGFSYGKS